MTLGTMAFRITIFSKPTLAYKTQNNNIQFNGNQDNDDWHNNIH
jgi:hypothetical protein